MQSDILSILKKKKKKKKNARSFVLHMHIYGFIIFKTIRPKFLRPQDALITFRQSDQFLKMIIFYVNFGLMDLKFLRSQYQNISGIRAKFYVDFEENLLTRMLQKAQSVAQCFFTKIVVHIKFNF
eukprot:TRINITY_DN1938_c0_g1_i9.p2 TRINITY_DN1938_c0_g1~~TRINITY_DN1938_c0_g1_i9.p2  ORF type:complete len:125 (-),score=0.55 TRINITY_DN1938_c0_g1_i9:823-1197(-)